MRHDFLFYPFPPNSIEKCGALDANIACIRNEEEERIVKGMNEHGDTLVGLFQCDRGSEVGVGVGVGGSA